MFRTRLFACLLAATLVTAAVAAEEPDTASQGPNKEMNFRGVRMGTNGWAAVTMMAKRGFHLQDAGDVTGDDLFKLLEDPAFFGAPEFRKLLDAPVPGGLFPGDDRLRFAKEEGNYLYEVVLALPHVVVARETPHATAQLYLSHTVIVGIAIKIAPSDWQRNEAPLRSAISQRYPSMRECTKEFNRFTETGKDGLGRPMDAERFAQAQFPCFGLAKSADSISANVFIGDDAFAAKQRARISSHKVTDRGVVPIAQPNLR